MNGSSIDYQLYSTVNMHYSKFAYFHRVGGRNLIIKTISAELDWAELGNKWSLYFIAFKIIILFQ